jgi:tetratricopeptide (TPR) repeat protein
MVSAAEADFEQSLKDAYRLCAAGEYAAGLAASQSAAARARDIGSVGLELRAARIEASLLSLMSRKKESMARLDWALAVAGGERLPADLTELRVAHAVVACHLDWVETAGWVGIAKEERLRVLDRAEDLLKELGRPEWRTGVASMRSTLMRSMGRLDEAIALGEEAIRCFTTGAPGSTLASYRQQHADALLDAGRLDSAEVQYMAIMMEPGRAVRDEKSALVGLARCALRRGDAIVARSHAEKALTIARPLGDGAMCGALDILMQALKAAGELDHAAAVADQYIERARRAGEKGRLFYALRSQIDISFEREDDEGARAWLEEAAIVASALDRATGGDVYGKQVRTRRARLDKRS